MDWQLTFSEIVSPKSVEGERLGSNSLIEFATEFRSGIFATHSPEGEELGSNGL
jgi:hypothetical protein